MKSENATYTGFEFEVENFPAIAIINTDLKDPEIRRPYTHSVFIEIDPDRYNEYGHPTEEEHDFLIAIEKKIIAYLEEHTSSVHVGHTTVYRRREIIFYTKDPEPVQNYLDSYLLTIDRENSFEIEKDADWNNVSGFYELL
jgi:hypothetical protein